MPGSPTWSHESRFSSFKPESPDRARSPSFPTRVYAALMLPSSVADSARALNASSETGHHSRLMRQRLASAGATPARPASVTRQPARLSLRRRVRCPKNRIPRSVAFVLERLSCSRHVREDRCPRSSSSTLKHQPRLRDRSCAMPAIASSPPSTPWHISRLRSVSAVRPERRARPTDVTESQPRRSSSWREESLFKWDIALSESLKQLPSNSRRRWRHEAMCERLSPVTSQQFVRSRTQSAGPFASLSHSSVTPGYPGSEMVASCCPRKRSASCRLIFPRATRPSKRTWHKSFGSRLRFSSVN
mmetsp:Transcript_27781/g.66009  ORF Transcript_27781/g.66009 Transcript_27781/m.66009 type:complete len:303 (-) Transcript_27781:1335-2243(-)